MKTKYKRNNPIESIINSLKSPVDEVVMEVIEGDETRCFIVPYKEWLIIKEWYSNPANSNDYYLIMDDGENPCTIVRLDRKISAVRAHELSQAAILYKNITYILSSSLPKGMRFLTALCISLAILGAFSLAMLIKGAAVSLESLAPVMKLSTIIFFIYLLLNLEFAVIKILETIRDKYGVFTGPGETSLPGALVLNIVLLCLFAFNSPESIISFIKSLWEHIK